MSEATITGEVWQVTLLPVSPQHAKGTYGCTIVVNVPSGASIDSRSTLRSTTPGRLDYPIKSVTSSSQVINFESYDVIISADDGCSLPINVGLVVFRKNESDQLEVYRQIMYDEVLVLCGSSGGHYTFHHDHLPNVLIPAGCMFGIMVTGANTLSDAYKITINASVIVNQ